MDTFLWQADEKQENESNLNAYINWLGKHHQLHFSSYQELWKWSIDNIEKFWESVLLYFNVEYEGTYKKVIAGNNMPEISWFSGINLNYAEQLFRNKNDHAVAVIFRNEAGIRETFTWQEVKNEVAAFQKYLLDSGLERGDRCVAYLPNIPQALFAFLACNALGMVWSSCSPDFGVKSVIERFSQIEPKLFISCDGYYYGGKKFDRTRESKVILSALPTVQSHVTIGYLSKNKDDWESIVSVPTEEAEPKFVKVPFDHPIWILYSSGTTGIPKAITHGTGGVLLEHLKYLYLQNEVKQGQRYFWYSTTGWMMWNFANASLLAGATLIIYDGSPSSPDLYVLWRLAKEEKINHFGTSAPFLIACMKNDIVPSELELVDLISIGSTGAPLPPEAFSYVYEKVSKKIWLCSMAGGTDVCTAFVGSNIKHPVKSGKIQGRALGVALFAYDEEGNKVINQLGEMVIEKPLPSMPVYFWNDHQNERYKSSYFRQYPGIWRHGDWIAIDEDGHVVIYGRSDATLNRQGIRIGTSEIYSSVNKLKEIKDALVINLEFEDGSHFMPLFVMLENGQRLNQNLIDAIKKQLRSDYSPRHVPDIILEVPDIPYTLSGKKLEAPVKKILLGMALTKAANKEATRNPEALEYFEKNKDSILALK